MCDQLVSSDGTVISERGNDGRWRKVDIAATAREQEAEDYPDELQDPPMWCDLCGRPGTEQNPVGRVNHEVETYAHVRCPKALDYPDAIYLDDAFGGGPDVVTGEPLDRDDPTDPFPVPEDEEQPAWVDQLDSDLPY